MICKTFSRTKAREREALGDMVTEWIRRNRDLAIVEKQVLQSSDNEFHCLTVVLWCVDRKRRGRSDHG